MYWIGVDHHKRNTYVTSLKEDGSVHLQRNLSAQAHVLRAFFRDHPKPYVVGIEATYAWEYVADIVEGLGQEIRVGHPLLLKAFARRHQKNDKIDSRLSAWLLYRGDFPAIRHPDRKARRQRDLYRQRLHLVRRRSGTAARAKAFADRLGFTAEMNLSTRRGVAALAALPVGQAQATVLASHQRLLTFLYQEIEQLDKAIEAVAQCTPEVQWLMSVPGIGPYLALLIASEIFDIARFRRAENLVGYAGVAPGNEASGGKVFASHLAPSVNRYLRWGLCEAVGHYVRACPRLQAKYERLKRAKGWKTARLAIARHIALVVYHLLKERRPYRAEAPPAAAADPRAETTTTTATTTTATATLKGTNKKRRLRTTARPDSPGVCGDRRDARERLARPPAAT